MNISSRVDVSAAALKQTSVNTIQTYTDVCSDWQHEAKLMTMIHNICDEQCCVCITSSTI